MTRATGGDQTLHRKILDDIEGRILSGEWPPGFRLPFERDLAERHGCSRMTVNKVMTRLAQSGLIERQRRSGSFVTQPRAQSPVLEIRDIESEVTALGLSYAYRLAERIERSADAEDGRRMGVGPATRIVALVCVHFAGDKPFCVEERRINAIAVPAAARADFTEAAPGPWLLRQAPWTTAEHRIQATAASIAMARRLEVDHGSPCLVIERRTWGGAGPVTWVRFTYPGDDHALVARFTPSSP